MWFEWSTVTTAPPRTVARIGTGLLVVSYWWPKKLGHPALAGRVESMRSEPRARIRADHWFGSSGQSPGLS